MGRAPEGFCDGHAVEMNNVSLQYDAFGRRIKNLAGTSFLYNGANAAQKLSGSTVTANLVSGGVDEAFTRADSSGSFTPLKDALGSTIALVDSSGNVQTSYTYDPFGGTSVTGSNNSNEFQYTGRENDGNGLYYYRTRYYTTVLGRFISQDPMGFAGSGPDLYAYVGNDPINFRDPFGLRKHKWQAEGGEEAAPPEAEEAIREKEEEAEGWIELEPGETFEDLFPIEPTLAGRPGCSYFDWLNPGPLPESIAKTFRGGRYVRFKVGPEGWFLKDARVYGGAAHEFGRNGTFYNPIPQVGGIQSLIDNALRPEWGNTAQEVTSRLLEPGTTIYIGTTASQGDFYLGGTVQIYVPNK